MPDKKVYFVSCTAGRRTALTRRAFRILADADTWIGPEGLIDAMKDPASGRTSAACIPVEAGGDLEGAIREAAGETVAVLCPGDAGGSSVICATARNLREFHPVILPGIPDLLEFSARTGISYEHAAFVDLTDGHGSLVLSVMRHRRTFAALGEHAPMYLEDLVRAGYEDLAICRMTRPTPGRENIEVGALAQFTGQHAPPGLYYFQRKTSPAFLSPGIPDQAFLRGNIPMTKQEVRTLVLSALSLEENETVWDIGAGTGSVTVEMAMEVQEGNVFAIEEKEEGVRLIEENLRKFGLHNVQVIFGTAPLIFDGLPTPDAAFIGGSGGHFRDIFQILLSRNPGVRIVVTAISLETVNEAIELMELYHMGPRVVQVGVSHAKKVGRSHMMMAQNPIYIISGQRTDKESGVG